MNRECRVDDQTSRAQNGAPLLQAESQARALRWFIGHAHEIDHTPGLSVGQLRRDTQRYAPRLQVRAATCWQTWLNEVIDPVTALDEADRRLRDMRFVTGEYCYGLECSGLLFESSLDEGGESG